MYVVEYSPVLVSVDNFEILVVDTVSVPELELLLTVEGPSAV